MFSILLEQSHFQHCYKMFHHVSELDTVGHADGTDQGKYLLFEKLQTSLGLSLNIFEPHHSDF